MPPQIENLQIYQLSMEIGERLWNIVTKWKFFERDTIGKQIVRAIDSVAANLSEGYGRFHFNENRQFCYYARGSLFETLTWLTKSHTRGLISNEEFESIKSSLEAILIKLNNYINSIGKKKTK